MEASLTLFTKDEIKSLLDDVIKQNDITEYEIEVSKGAEKGDGYLSCVIKVDVIGGNKTLPLIIKCAPRTKITRSVVPLRLIYEREIYMYETFFPAIMKFQKEKNIKSPFGTFPKCYKTSREEGKELIVLENIKDSGFKLWNRKKYMPEDHIIFVFQEYGKYHGTALALRDQKQEEFEQYAKNLFEHFSEENTPPKMFDQFFNSMDKLKDLFCPEEENEYYTRALKLRSIVESFYKVMLTTIADHPVVVHGDCWCNNMMFAYDDVENPTKPTRLCLLDFQMSKLASPVFDLSYFFYVSADAKMMENLEHYLKIYHQSLREHVTALGSDPDKLYTFDNLMTDWKKYCIAGFVSGTLVFKAMLRDKDEIIDIGDLKKDEQLMDIFTKDCKSDVFVNKRTKDVLVHMYKRDFIP